MTISREDRDYYNYCGILPHWHEATFDQFVNDAKALSVVTKYLDNPKQAISDGVGFFLYGANGTGKTLLMNCAFKQLIKSGYTVRIISMSSLITEFSNSWYDKEAKRALNRMLRKTHFLGIEEIGKEFRSQNSDLGIVALDHILRIRVQMNLPTWITSNKEPSSLASFYTEDIASMLRQHCVSLQVKGADFRKTISENHKEKYK
jgi:DNA replication protein DnaC